MFGELDADRIELCRIKYFRTCGLRENHDAFPLRNPLCTFGHDSLEIIARVLAVHGNAAEPVHDVSEVRHVQEGTFDYETEFPARAYERMHQRGFQQAHVIADNHRRFGKTGKIAESAQVNLPAAAFDDTEIFQRIIRLRLSVEVMRAAASAGIIKHIEITQVKGETGSQRQIFPQAARTVFRRIIGIFRKGSCDIFRSKHSAFIRGRRPPRVPDK